MKWVAILCAGVGIGLVLQVGGRLSADALSLALRVLVGVCAPIPALMLARSRQRSAPPATRPRNQVVIICAPTQRHAQQIAADDDPFIFIDTEPARRLPAHGQGQTNEY